MLPFIARVLVIGSQCASKQSKISDGTKKDVFRLKFHPKNEAIGQQCCRAYFSSNSQPLTRWVLKGVLKESLLNNWLWIAWEFFFLLLQQYFSSAINVLTNSPKISDATERDVCSRNIPDKNEAISQKSCSAYFSSVWDPLTRWVLKGILKSSVWEIKVTRSFRVNNFGDSWATSLTSFFKILKIWWRFQKWNKKLIKGL